MVQARGSSGAMLAILFSCQTLVLADEAADQGNGETTVSNVKLRGHLDNARSVFERQKRGHVAFIGGSITEMNGYRPMVSENLKRRFPQTEFTFTNAGISSTCSTTGAFRLESDVLSKGPVDLFFIEFAVNDDQDAGHAARECLRGMEGLIRQTRRHNPRADIVITYFVNPGMLEALQKGTTPVSIGSHDQVARHYDVSTIHLAQEVADRITAGKLTWKQFGGTHPAPRGNAICADMIEQLFNHAWRQPLPESVAAPGPLPNPLDPLSYSDGGFVDPQQAQVKSGWKYQVPDWKSLPGGKRSRFTSLPMLCADAAGAELTLKFQGAAVGAYVVAGPDAGVLEARVDGGEARAVNLYHRFSRGLHYPRTVMFATDLQPGEHTLTLRVSAKTQSRGHAARIMQFVVNGAGQK